jgi:diguanylate cyclase (GGDEF)-like protein
MTLKMTHLAQHDFLTNLPNRLLLNDRIEQAITLAKRRKTQIAILFLDLDNFKHINDSLGHAAGDLLLQSVTACLNRCIRSSDTVSRQGGDEFVILLDEGKTGEEAAVIADKILAEFCLPHQVGNSQLHITTSIGISIYPIDGEDAEALIKNADTAMYSAKEKGRNNYQFFRSEMNARAIERQIIEANLRTAIERQEFVLHYQPKISLHSGLITGAEALIRWKHQQWGTLMPDRFIAIAEDCGLIVPIGRWVLHEACRQHKVWLDEGMSPGTIAVNISALEFRHKNFVEGIHKTLKDTDLEPRYLQLEITESVLMHDAEASIEVLLALKRIGVHVAADDFGTGYSSLSYLQKFPIDILKIDQSFVCELSAGSHSSFIVNAIISMAKSLQLKVVAEGIETKQQLNLLQKQRCDEGQGHIFSKPLSAEHFQALVSPLVWH